MKIHGIYILLLLFVLDTNAAVKTPTLYSPKDKTVELPTAVTLIYFLGYLESAEVEVSTSSNFQASTTYWVDTSAHQLKNLELNTDYYWRVRAFKASDTSGWSSTYQFTTDDKPRMITPNSGSELQPVTAFSWFRTASIDTFILHIDTTSSFSSGFYQKHSVIDTFQGVKLERVVENLRFGQTVYTRLISADGKISTDVYKNSVIDSVSALYPKRFATAYNHSFLWSYYAGIPHYQVQVDTSPLFNSNILLNNIYRTDTLNYSPQWGWGGVDMYKLASDDMYYWRVRGMSAHDTSAWSYQSFYLDRVPDPYFETHSYPEKRYGWSKIHGSNGYIYGIDTVEDFSSPYYQEYYTDTIHQLLTELPFGRTIYTRVKTFSDYDTTAWSDTEKSKVAFGYNDILTGLSDGDTAVTLTPNFRVSSNSKGLIGTQIQVARDSTYTQLVIDSFVRFPDHSISDVLLHWNTTYYWRARVYHAKDTARWTPYPGNTFTTKSRIETLSPVNDTTRIATNSSGSDVYFLWSKIPEHKHYQIRFDTVPTFNSPVLVDSQFVNDKGQILVHKLFYNTVYYWTIRYINPGVDSSQWASVKMFKMPKRVRLHQPANNNWNMEPEQVKFTWYSMGRHDGYIFQIDTSEDFNDPYEVVKHPDTLFHPVLWLSDSVIKLGGKYVWRVKMFHERDTSEWSIPSCFGLRDSVVAQLTLPHNNSLLSDTLVGFEWVGAAGLNRFVLEVSENPDMSDSIVVSASKTSRELTLNSGRDYYWRVLHVKDGDRYGEWSDVWHFTTDNLLPVKYLVPSPLDVYPNPVQDAEVYVELPANVPRKAVDIQVISGTGQHIPIHWEPTSTGYSIYFTDLNAGVYFINIQSEGNVYRTKVVVTE